MVNISEISDDSHDGDQNKKPEEQVLRRSRRISTRNENQNKKPKEEEEKDNRSISFPIPDDLTEACVALIRRCDYPSLSSVSSYFFTLIASSRLYETRSRLGLSETFLYAAIKFPDETPPKWYILHRNKVSSLRLTELSSLPPMPYGCSVLTIGQEMYVISGIIDRRRLPLMTLIDCRTHKCRSLPRMKRGRYHAAAGVIDGKIYVIGGFRKRKSESEWIEVFDLKKQSWESLPGPYPKTSSGSQYCAHVVMEDKLYILDAKRCLVYDPKIIGGWDASVGATVPLMDLWKKPLSVQCVVDDMLYTFDRQCTLGHPIVVYNPKNKTWRPVKGVALGRLPGCPFYKPEMANFGGKLVILGNNESYNTDDCIGEKGIWCGIIQLEKRQGGEIWGKVKSLDFVLGDINFPTVLLCRTLTI
ncbi:Kelch repeat type 1 [Arabidopsis thaliana x Arabidopsis arenosa]|uniref:Kelch repeat type 1 n=1 Tax=Arabidopsis thaliana x Arabidopsis arenosa TaxID=1240361 RepID=A0A8T2CA66_9BRAS|nr:Kelch repeat type 1 [Arabidopsis thaliana x Arabidopsis arenosa]